MTTANRSTLLPSVQQLLGMTPRTSRKTGRRWSRRAALGLGAAGTLGAFGLIACGAPAVPGASYVKPVSTAGSRPIKIAVLAPLTGGGASIGAQQLGFARLAIDEFNRANGTSYG